MSLKGINAYKKGNLKQELSEPAPTVQWPVGELKVSVWLDGKIVKETSAFDPDIQSFEIGIRFNFI